MAERTIESRCDAPVSNVSKAVPTTESMVLRAWQRDALEAWRTAGRCGVVEAVTGTGKTMVGVAAIGDVLGRGGVATVLVPGLDLQEQWVSVLRGQLPGARVGRYGGGFRDGRATHDVLVSTVQSAGQVVGGVDGVPHLLVADEVHRYGSARFALALREYYDERLGLTATFERSDDGVPDVLHPYFGTVITGCDYARARADAIIARIRVLLVAVSFSTTELEQFDEWNGQARSERGNLISRFGCPAEPFGEFMKSVQALSELPGSEPPTRSARRYLKAFTARRQLLAGCAGKVEALEALAPALVGAGRSLVFSETKASATRAAAVLDRPELITRTFSSHLDRRERQELLVHFREGIVKVLAAPRVLDEGIDVPEADVGVVLAASRSRRQMIQRMGRVVRPKPDSRAATFVVLYVRGSSEDPQRGAHEGFLQEMLDVADEVVRVDGDAAAAQLGEWLTEAAPVTNTHVAEPGDQAPPDLIEVIGDDARSARGGVPSDREQSLLDAARYCAVGGWTVGLGSMVLSADAASAPEVQNARVALLRAVSTLDPTSAKIVMRRSGLGGGRAQTLDEVGHSCGLAREQVEQLEQAAVLRLKSPDVRAFLTDIAATVAR